MIRTLSEKIMLFVICNTKPKKLSDTEQQVYLYGIELLIASVCNCLCILFVGFLVGKPFESLVFLLCFIPLRQYTGGYHANSYILCNVVFVSSYIGVSILSWKVGRHIQTITVAIILALSLLPLYLFCPVEHLNKPLDTELKSKCRMVALVIWVVLSIVATQLFAYGSKYGPLVFFTLLLVEILVTIGRHQERRKNKC